jgi:hypothetical protein
MPESSETLADQIENDQDQSKNEQSIPQSEQTPPVDEVTEAGNGQAQPPGNQTEPDSEQAQTNDNKNETKAELEKARAALKSILSLSGRRKRGKYTEDDVLLRFTSCGRCGLFLTTYRLNHNLEFLEAIEEIEADWLIFPWYPAMRELVTKSFGSPVDIGLYYLEGTCPECQRPFSFVEMEPDQQAWFLIKI